MSKNPIDAYKQVKTSQEVSPYRTVQLLLEGALQRVMLAKQALAEGDTEIRGMAVGSTITILGVLQAALQDLYELPRSRSSRGAYASSSGVGLRLGRYWLHGHKEA